MVSKGAGPRSPYPQSAERELECADLRGFAAALARFGSGEPAKRATYQSRVSSQDRRDLSDSSPLRGSQNFCLLITQGSQSLDLGLNKSAASQLFEYCRLDVG